jgi:hypothetical protein
MGVEFDFFLVDDEHLEAVLLLWKFMYYWLYRLHLLQIRLFILS